MLLSIAIYRLCEFTVNKISLWKDCLSQHFPGCCYSAGTQQLRDTPASIAFSICWKKTVNFFFVFLVRSRAQACAIAEDMVTVAPR